jgi:glycine cleavage system aminomethyltransferase T
VVYFESEDAGIAAGDPVLEGDTTIGVVRSGAVTPTVGRFLGFAQVTPPQAIGTQLMVRTGAGAVPIRIAKKGMYDPNNDRLRVRPG